MKFEIALKSRNSLEIREFDIISFEKNFQIKPSSLADFDGAIGRYCFGYDGTELPVTIEKIDNQNNAINLRFSDNNVAKLVFFEPIKVGSKAKYSIVGSYENSIFEVSVLEQK
ncbi:hypothetical protein [Marinobacterium lacunae]|uniref:hypothetical protein n=1 Tax=Marinobacterium lacunae TaxID=1232683 RepID=UPI00055E930E|nr:hypothetical protein [Marinobacterium lacunae]